MQKLVGAGGTRIARCISCVAFGNTAAEWWCAGGKLLHPPLPVSRSVEVPPPSTAPSPPKGLPLGVTSGVRCCSGSAEPWAARRGLSEPPVRRGAAGLAGEQKVAPERCPGCSGPGWAPVSQLQVSAAGGASSGQGGFWGNWDGAGAAWVPLGVGCRVSVLVRRPKSPHPLPRSHPRRDPSVRSAGSRWFVPGFGCGRRGRQSPGGGVGGGEALPGGQRAPVCGSHPPELRCCLPGRRGASRGPGRAGSPGRGARAGRQALPRFCFGNNRRLRVPVVFGAVLPSCHLGGLACPVREGSACARVWTCVRTWFPWACVDVPGAALGSAEGKGGVFGAAGSRRQELSGGLPMGTGWGLLRAVVGRGGCLASPAWSVPARPSALQSVGFPGAPSGSAPAARCCTARCRRAPVPLWCLEERAGLRCLSRVLPVRGRTPALRGCGSSGASLAKPGSAACFGVKPRHCLLAASKAVSRRCGWCGGGNRRGVPIVLGVSASPLGPRLLSVLAPCAPREPVSGGCSHPPARDASPASSTGRADGEENCPGPTGSSKALSPEPPLLEELTPLWFSSPPACA